MPLATQASGAGMSDLLIHSMAEFGDLILHVLDLAGASRVVEIGAEFGSMTQPLGDYCERRGGQLIAIDPAPAPAFLDWAADRDHVQHLAGTSLDQIDRLSAIDAWLIDGDHNYFTVYHELCAIDALGQSEGRPLLAILHDVGWPWSRRDLYYAPERIPVEFLHPYSFDAGVTLDNPVAQIGRGFRGMGQFAVAMHAGGPRNGVLTAIEDFCHHAESDGRRLLYAHIPAVFGLGVLFDAAAPWAQNVADAVIPYHDNPLLARLERNRLANYLAVLDWQDGHFERPAA
jgi:hypothetical protein